MIRLSRSSDIDNIMMVVNQTIDIMARKNNPQWNEHYPTRSDFLKDIETNNLYIYEIDNEIGGLLCLNKEEPEEYGAVSWSLPNTAVVLHRMTVNPVYRRQQIGTKLLLFAEKYALQTDCYYLKTDTYSMNYFMNYLFIKVGYRKTGEIHMNNKPKSFNCYEKILIHK
ncbi:MAG: GNAT family N-acetyltransferase [Bacteroidales bacterium]|nr:GNAT family N-acetyltransferase [Bacteroidales bacterium]